MKKTKKKVKELTVHIDELEKDFTLEDKNVVNEKSKHQKEIKDLREHAKFSKSDYKEKEQQLKDKAHD